MPAVAGPDDVPVLEPDPRVRSRNSIAVARVTRRAPELLRESDSVPLGDSAGETDVHAGSLLVAVLGRGAREGVQSVDTLGGDGHAPRLATTPLAFSGRLNAPPARRFGVRALNYLELAGPLERSGIATAARQQRSALVDTDVDVIDTPWRGGNPLSGAASLATGRGAIREFDLAHLHLFGPGSVAVLRHARRADVPVVAHAHTLAENTTGSWRGVDHIEGPLRRYLRWFYAQADLVLCPTGYAADLVRDYPVGTPTGVLTGGVDRDSLAGFEQFRTEYRDRFDLDGLVVFSVGNVFERKGLTTFCRLAQATDHDFVWFGPYDTGPVASRSVRRWVNDPPENVTFTGWVEEKRGMFAAGDVFCFPAKEETQGLVALEAMACGKPVVLRDIPVFREQFTDGEDCLLCADEAEFEAALERLAHDPALRERLGENARETAAEHDVTRMGDRLAAIYRDLVND